MLLLGHHTNPSFGVFIIFFDASSEVHLRSSLPSLHDVIKVPPFNHNVHHRGLWTEAAYGSLKPPPTRRLRRTYLHLSYSMTFTRLHDTSMAKKSKRVKNMRFSMMDGGDEMDNKWARLLAYVTGLVNQELLLQNEYLTAENRILKAHLQAGFRLTDDERTTLAEIGKRLGRKALQKVVGIAKPDTLYAWYRRLIAHKFDGSKQRLVGAMANLGHQLTDQTVGNI